MASSFVIGNEVVRTVIFLSFIFFAISKQVVPISNIIVSLSSINSAANLPIHSLWPGLEIALTLYSGSSDDVIIGTAPP